MLVRTKVVVLIGLFLIVLILGFSGTLAPIAPILAACIAIVSAVIAISGWQVVYENAQKIAARSELHQVVAAFMEKVEAIDKVGCEFWSQPTSKREEAVGVLVARRFLAMLETVRLLSEILKRRELVLNEFDADFSRLRSSLTLNVEEPGLIDEPRCMAKIVAISSASRRLRANAYSEFLQCHPPRAQ